MQSLYFCSRPKCWLHDLQGGNARAGSKAGPLRQRLHRYLKRGRILRIVPTSPPLGYASIPNHLNLLSWSLEKLFSSSWAFSRLTTTKSSNRFATFIQQFKIIITNTAWLGATVPVCKWTSLVKWKNITANSKWGQKKKEVTTAAKHYYYYYYYFLYYNFVSEKLDHLKMQLQKCQVFLLSIVKLICHWIVDKVESLSLSPPSQVAFRNYFLSFLARSAPQGALPSTPSNLFPKRKEDGSVVANCLSFPYSEPRLLWIINVQ